jgi:hypothetical protein
LELILRQRLEDLEDYEVAIQAHRDFGATGDRALTMDEIFGRA